MTLSANDLYTLKPVKTTGDVWGWDLIEDLDLVLDNFQSYDYEFLLGYSCEIEAKIVFLEVIDGKRIIQLSTLWFKEKPFAVYQLAGRGGLDHLAIYVTDKEQYLSFRRYIETFKKKENPEIFDPNEKVPDYTEFYGCKITLDDEGN